VSLYAFIDQEPRRKKIHPHYLTLLFEKLGGGLLQPATAGTHTGMVYPVHLGSPYRLSRDESPNSKSGGIFIYDHLDREALAAIIDNGGYLLIDHIVESYFGRRDMVERLHDGIAEARLDPKRVVLLNGNMISDRRYNSICNELGIDQRAEVIPYNGCFWLVNAHNQARGDDAHDIAARARRAHAALDAEKARKFVSFNGKGRPHRTYVVLRMIKDGYANDGFVSLLGHEADESPSIDKVAAQIRNFPGAEDLRQAIPGFVDSLPLTVDVSREKSRENMALKFVLPWASPDPEFYDKTHFSVVLDTSFSDEGTLFQTPIAYKSFMNFSPFVYFGNRGGLSCLRDLGFESFAPFINEGYDDIEDDNQRLLAAYGEFERLVNLSHAQLNEGVRSIWPKLVHNFNLIHRPGVDAFIEDWNGRVSDRLPEVPKLKSTV